MAISTENRLREILHLRFPGCETRLEAGESGARVAGILVWDGFEGKTHVERQNELWGVLDQDLNDDERGNVAPIVTMTQSEINALDET